MAEKYKEHFSAKEKKCITFQVLGGSAEIFAFSLGDISYISSSNFMNIIIYVVFELSLYFSQGCGS